MDKQDRGARIVAITGGASGIGAATAGRFRAAGCAVWILDVDEAGAQRVAAAHDAGFVRTDVADAASVDAAFDRIRSVHGRLDVLVNSAGVESRWRLDSMTDERWDRVLDVNLKGTMLCTRGAARLMREAGGGAVVNVASIAGKRMSYSGDASYTASKGAVLAFTRHAAFELAADRIRVTAVCPGPTLTPMIERNLSKQAIDGVVRSVPLGRWVQPADVAEAIHFLASDAAAMCTGTSLDVDGGVLVSNGSDHASYLASRS